MFFSQFVLGGFMVCLTVLIHAIVLDRLMLVLRHQGPQLFQRFHLLWKVPMLMIAVLGVFSAHIVQIWLWAILYYTIGALKHFEECLYFATVAFTTVGFGDIVLDKNWRLLSAFQAGNGLLLFGWSTAFIFEVMAKLYDEQGIGRKRREF